MDRGSIGWGGEIVGCGGGPATVRPAMRLSGDLRTEIVGTDLEWERAADELGDGIGFFGLIAGAIAGIAGAVSAAAGAAAATVGPLVAAAGGVAALGKTIEGGVKRARALVKAAEDGDEKALKEIKRAKGDADAKKAAAYRKKAEGKLAETMVRARAGDINAQATIAGLKIMTDEHNKRIGPVASFIGRWGKLPANAKKMFEPRQVLLAQAGKDWEKFVAIAMKRAKASGQWPKKPAPNKFPTEKMVMAARTGVKQVLRKTLEKRKATKTAGARGLLVTPGGRIRRGRWLPGQAA